MALVVGTNSWETVIEADAYLSNRIGTSEWFALLEAPIEPGDNAKETFLSSAFFWLQGAPQVEIPSSSTDDDVKNAQSEAALFLVEHYNELNERRAAISTGVESFKYSKREERFNAAQLSIPDYILGMLQTYMTQNTTVLLGGEYDV